MKCPECGEPVQAKPPKQARSGWTRDVEERRLKHSHKDGEPLCPVMTKTGYQPAMPKK